MIQSINKSKIPNAFAFGIFGADDRSRTDDLILTKDALYLLSYISVTLNIIHYKRDFVNSKM